MRKQYDFGFIFVVILFIMFLCIMIFYKGKHIHIQSTSEVGVERYNACYGLSGNTEILTCIGRIDALDASK